MIKIIKLFLIFVFVFNGCSNEKNEKVVAVLSEIPPLKVYSCDNDSITISINAKNALMEAGMTQCMMPFDKCRSEYAKVLFSNGWKDISRNA